MKSDTPRTDAFAKEMFAKHDPLVAYKSAGVNEIEDWEEFAKGLERELARLYRLPEGAAAFDEEAEFTHWWDTVTTSSGDSRAMARSGWLAALRTLRALSQGEE